MQRIAYRSDGRSRRRGPLFAWALLLPLMLVLASAHIARAASPAKPAPPAAKPAAQQGIVTPPLIAGGKWPAFSIAGSFNPKQIANPRVNASWVVDAKGCPQDIRLNKSSGSKPVDKAIIGYIRRLRFIPATRDNKPVAAPMALPFNLSAGKG